MLMDEKTKQIILSQSINLAQKECMHMSSLTIDRDKIKELAKIYYQLIVESNQEMFGTNAGVITDEKKELKIDL